ncbi:MAG TPA: autotransporter assembly complex family protein [Dokdonella sp.]|uniref:autotransporter assembly complex protein TamA n=1 Tax=Dokdonella sp. TaxID=2291710 RepID=UPI002D7F9C60|nr:autotransporter assembly complex family protein [Dokdonella sp.]HET9033587.1 autotransporter assembly complex family protein [Dokdonella sp.]
MLTMISLPSFAARVSVKLDGLNDTLRPAALGALELQQYTKREVSGAQVRRLYRRAETQIKKALEPYGYYNSQVDADLSREGDNFLVTLQVTPGDPVKVTAVDIKIDIDPKNTNESKGLKAVHMARAAFSPHKGQRLDHAEYERSKAAIHAALFSVGYLDTELVTHRVDVERASNTAQIHLEWKVGERYRFAETEFEGGQFPDDFMQRFIPWDVGDYYNQAQLLTLQQRLFDANYFAISQVQPDTENAGNGKVPIAVTLAPAKRNVYTGGVFVGTDTGAGVRGGVERRWVNTRGHKLKFEAILAQRLKTLSTLYQIPLPGKNNHSFNFGISYRDENTKTSQSKTFRLAANDSQIWHGWTRTIGLQFLTGDFKVADIKGKTTLLYPEISLTKKRADDFNFPRKGWSLTLAARAGQKGLLSDTNFAQITADAKWIRGIGDNSRFIARGAAGYTQVGNFDKLPPELRFFAGGDRSIRGYSYQTVGPRLPAVDGEVPKVIGGEQLLVGSAEYEYYFTPKWGAAAFVDAGDAFSGKDFDLKLGAGFGLRWRSPVGLVRVDLGTPIGDKFASGVELHIVIGPDL